MTSHEITKRFTTKREAREYLFSDAVIDTTKSLYLDQGLTAGQTLAEFGLERFYTDNKSYFAWAFNHYLPKPKGPRGGSRVGAGKPKGSSALPDYSKVSLDDLPQKPEGIKSKEELRDYLFGTKLAATQLHYVEEGLTARKTMRELGVDALFSTHEKYLYRMFQHYLPRERKKK